MKRIIEISGPDGSGKSTLTRALNVSFPGSILIWLRFRLFTGRIVNLFGRVLGLSYYEHYGWGKIGYHNYVGFYGNIYALSVYVDSFLYHYLVYRRLLKKANTIILDRYLVDTCVDLIVSTRKVGLTVFLFHGLLKRHLVQCEAVILTCRYSVTCQRRPDILDDKVYVTKQAAYRIVSRVFQIPMLDTEKNSVESLVNGIRND